VFRGRVIVRPDAQKTSASQSNANLLLGSRAEIDTKPQLEIYADDVKCSHGRRSAGSTRTRSSTCARAGCPSRARATCSARVRARGARALPARALAEGLDDAVIDCLRRAHGETAVSYDVAAVRKDFPILARRIHGKPLAFLDSAASAQKPRAVIDAVSELYSAHYANVHRGVYQLSLESTEMLEAVRDKTAAFLGARDRHEIVFTSNATEAINLVAYSYGRRHVGPGDEVLVTHMEHHANFVPWQVLCEERGAVLRVAPIDDRGVLLLDEFEKLLSPRTRIAAVTHVSNVSEPSTPCARSRGCAARTAFRCSSTAPRRYRTSASTSARSAATSTCSRATRCSDRRGSACCGAAPRCSRRCRRSSPVAR
jgi:hypothetical protein